LKPDDHLSLGIIQSYTCKRTTGRDWETGREKGQEKEQGRTTFTQEHKWNHNHHHRPPWTPIHPRSPIKTSITSQISAPTTQIRFAPTIHTNTTSHRIAPTTPTTPTQSAMVILLYLLYLLYR
jgi:hypothetical protein